VRWPEKLFTFGWKLRESRDILANATGPTGGQIRRKGNSMASDRQNLQDAFLNHVRKTKVPVTVFLINGVKLQGVITWFDNFCVLLRRDGQSQLVYKHAISTIMPSTPISLYEGEDAS
jgi:host factor-I protein